MTKLCKQNKLKPDISAKYECEHCHNLGNEKSEMCKPVKNQGKIKSNFIIVDGELAKIKGIIIKNLHLKGEN
jgi:RNA polymerase subunit RPABC4/transcription elongation factor Spt4